MSNRYTECLIKIAPDEDTFKKWSSVLDANLFDDAYIEYLDPITCLKMGLPAFLSIKLKEEMKSLGIFNREDVFALCESSKESKECKKETKSHDSPKVDPLALGVSSKEIEKPNVTDYNIMRGLPKYFNYELLKILKECFLTMYIEDALQIFGFEMDESFSCKAYKGDSRGNITKMMYWMILLDQKDYNGARDKSDHVIQYLTETDRSVSCLNTAKNMFQYIDLTRMAMQSK